MDFEDLNIPGESNSAAQIPGGSDTVSLASSSAANSGLSQMDYIPTPYLQTQWEGSDSFDLNPRFQCIPLEVLESDEFRRDSMFEIFEEPLSVGKFQQLPELKKEQELGTFELSEEDRASIRNEGYEQGFIDGKREGVEYAQAELNEAYEELAKNTKNIANIAHSITEEVERRIIEVEQKAIGLALNIARKIVSTAAEARPEYIQEIVRKGILQMGTLNEITVFVGPDDFEFLTVVGLPDSPDVDQALIKYVLDEKITSGCRIEGTKGILNLELDQMWLEIKNSLFSAVGD